MLFSHAAVFHAGRSEAANLQAVPKRHHRERLLLLAQSGREEVVAPDTDSRPPARCRVRTSSDAQIIVDAGRPAGGGQRRRARANFGARATATSARRCRISSSPIARPSCAPRIERAHAERHDTHAARTCAWERDGTRRFLDIIVVAALRRRPTLLGTRVIVRRRHAAQDAAGGAGALEAGARDRLRGAAVDQRGARDHQRGTAVHGRGAGDHQRGAAVDQRRARDDERGAAVHQRGAADDERRAAQPQHRAELDRTPSSNRSSPACAPRSSSSIAICAYTCGTPARPTCGELRADEARGTHFFTLDIGLPVAELHQPIRDVLHGGTDASRADACRRTAGKGGRSQCRVTVSPLRRPTMAQ